MISTLIFDLDGTLFDSTSANIKAYSLAFAEAGLRFNANQYRKFFGLRFNEMMEALAPNSNQETRLRVRELKSGFYQANLDLVLPNKALLSFIDSVKSYYKIALVTTASRKNVDNLLHKFLKSNNPFGLIITGEDVNMGKPDPECYKLAISKLSVMPSECLVFEDSDVGIEAAHKAGLEVIKITI